MPNHVPVSFARQLERELANMTAERDTLRTRLNRAEELLGEASGAIESLIEHNPEARLKYYKDALHRADYVMSLMRSVHPSTPPKSE